MLQYQLIFHYILFECRYLLLRILRAVEFLQPRNIRKSSFRSAHTRKRSFPLFVQIEQLNYITCYTFPLNSHKNPMSFQEKKIQQNQKNNEKKKLISINIMRVVPINLNYIQYGIINSICAHVQFSYFLFYMFFHRIRFTSLNERQATQRLVRVQCI